MIKKGMLQREEVNKMLVTSDLAASCHPARHRIIKLLDVVPQNFLTNYHHLLD